MPAATSSFPQCSAASSRNSRLSRAPPVAARLDRHRPRRQPNAEHYKMRLSVTVAVVLAVTLIVLAAHCSAAPRYDDDGKNLADRDIQVWRELTTQMLLQLLRAHGDFGPMYHHKRNSEIINSLLGLPKTMTDAGRK